MELYHLKTFVTVAEEGHLTRAAERLYTSQPAISAHNDVITSVAVSPDGKLVATAGMDNSVRFWDTKGARLGALPRALSPVLPRSNEK